MQRRKRLAKKPNYAFEKRQKEIAKKQKKEDKRLQKATGNEITPQEQEQDAVPVSDNEEN
ncbi:MAG: hypothetical protein ACJAWL_000920 [Motiliproteus sp.]|jgi:hypothetical protein